MKSKAPSFLKQVLSLLASIVKAKSAALKSKTSAVKTRLIIFGLLHNKKVIMSAISNKLHTLMGHENEGGGDATAADGSLAINVQCVNAVAKGAPPECTLMRESGGGEIVEEEEEEDCYPDLRHSLFDDEDAEFGGSVIDLVKNSRGQDRGEFVLEDEIDYVAELFIKRFHRQMMMQRLESFKRLQEIDAADKCLR